MEINFTIDWIGVTAKHRDDFKYFDYAYPSEHLFTQEKPIHGYNQSVCNAYFARILWHTERKEMGVHCTYSGQSLNIHANNGITKERVVRYHVVRGDKFTRLDVALDVTNSSLKIRNLAAQLKRSTAKTRFQTWSYVDSTAGQTLYLGSRQSEQFLRIYDKGAEQRDGSNWIRVELEMKGSRAQMFASDTAHRSTEETAQATRAAIKHLVEFKGAVWGEIVGDIAIGIAKAREGQTDTVAWLLGSVAPAMGRYIAKHGDNGLTEKFLMVVASYAENAEMGEIAQTLEKTLTDL